MNSIARYSAASKLGAKRRTGMTRARRALEFKFHLSVVQLLDLILPPDADYHHSPNEGKRTPRQGADLKRMGMKPGEPDLRIGYQGRADFIEMKLPGEPGSFNQIERTARLRACGHRVAKAETLEEVVEALISFGIPIRQTNLSLSSLGGTDGHHSTIPSRTGCNSHPAQDLAPPDERR